MYPNEPTPTRELLTSSAEGDPVALKTLMALTYDELRALAGAYLRNERDGHTLQPTALVNEAWLKLCGNVELGSRERATFLAIAARAMRQVLVDHAVRRGAQKRGGDKRRVTLSLVDAEIPTPAIDFEVLEEVLDRLEAVNPDYVRVVQLRFFSGMRIEEIASSLDVSARTVKRLWRGARAWLSVELDQVAG